MITEKEAIVLYDDWYDDNDKYNLEHWVKMFKDHGFIKKSKLEEARDFANDCGGGMVKNVYERGICTLAELYEEAIKEKCELGQAE